MSKFFEEFREFAIRGNVIDLTVGVIIGGAFSKIVDSMVKDLVMPVVSLFTGEVNFSNWFIILGKLPDNYTGAMTYEALTHAGVPLFAYGNFITILINFFILAMVVFIMVRQINRLKRFEQTKPAPVTPPSEEVLLLRDIRDLIKGTSK